MCDGRGAALKWSKGKGDPSHEWKRAVFAHRGMYRSAKVQREVRSVARIICIACVVQARLDVAHEEATPRSKN